jgi:hypothetical protein
MSLPADCDRDNAAAALGAKGLVGHERQELAPAMIAAAAAEVGVTPRLSEADRLERHEGHEGHEGQSFAFP